MTSVRDHDKVKVMYAQWKLAGEFGNNCKIPRTINKRLNTCTVVVNNGDLTTPVAELKISTKAKHWITVRILLVFSNNNGCPNREPKKMVLNNTTDQKDDEMELYEMSHLLGGWFFAAGEDIGSGERSGREGDREKKKLQTNLQTTCFSPHASRLFFGEVFHFSI